MSAIRGWKGYVRIANNKSNLGVNAPEPYLRTAPISIEGNLEAIYIIGNKNAQFISEGNLELSGTIERVVLTDNSWLTVRTTSGITGFIGVGNKPTPLPQKEVKTILKFMTMEAPKYKAAFTLGEAVKIIEGPFADFLGTVEHIDEEKGKVRVLVSIFGRETPVELDFLQVTKI